MKKVIVLTVLFALPIIAYLFFASGVNHFAKLPILTHQVASLKNFTSLTGEKVELHDKITILLVYGDDIEKMEGNAFNLNEKIYKKNYNFNDFQFVVLAENGTEEQARNLMEELSSVTDTKKWKFVFGTKKNITTVFNSLKTDIRLNENKATPYVFIIDKNQNLRGRDDDSSKKEGDKYGYDTRSVAELSDKMTDDVKVILAEYRLALKKYKKDKS